MKQTRIIKSTGCRPHRAERAKPRSRDPDVVRAKALEPAGVTAVSPSRAA
jgi:hypothetical protein